MDLSSPILINRTKIDNRGRVPIGRKMMTMMKLQKGEEVEVRYIEAYQGSKQSIIVIQKVEKK